MAVKFLAAVVAQAQSRSLLPEDHFSVDGTLLEAWASLKSFRPKDGGGDPPGPGRNGARDFHGEKRSNATPRGTRRVTLGVDKAYVVSDFVGQLRMRKVTPHIADNDHLTKTGKRRKTRHKGKDRVGWMLPPPTTWSGGPS